MRILLCSGIPNGDKAIPISGFLGDFYAPHNDDKCVLCSARNIVNGKVIAIERAGSYIKGNDCNERSAHHKRLLWQ